MKDNSQQIRERPILQARESVGPSLADLQPTVEWQVNGVCNYDCSYCIQSRKNRTGMPSARTISGIIDSFSRLGGLWEIKMSGGEPFAFPGFMAQVVPYLLDRTPHLVSVLTNLSAPLPVLNRFAALTGGRLRVVSASFHPEYAEIEDVVEKAAALKETMCSFNPSASIVVNSVLAPRHLFFQREVKRRLEAAGLRYFPQLMKTKEGIHPYNAEELALVEELTNASRDPRKVNRAPDYHGIPCEAGHLYFVVDQAGEAFSCRTAKRHRTTRPEACLGNLGSGTFSLLPEGGPCPFTICPCTVPANRGIVRIPPDTSTSTCADTRETRRAHHEDPMDMDNYIRSRASRFMPLSAAGRSLDGVLSWNITEACNYSCSYCTQRFAPSRKGKNGIRPEARSPHDRLRTISKFLDSLQGHWEAKLSGGEPFEDPDLFPIAAALVERGNVVSIQTNFSAPPESLLPFLELTKGALHVFSASLHLGYDTPEGFLRKARLVQPYAAHGLHFHVTSVATPQRLAELRDRVAPFFRDNGILFKIQPEKEHGALVPYTPEEREILLSLGGHNMTGAIAHDLQGRLCHAGSRYFVVQSDGMAYRCYPASRVGGRYAHLGSLAGGVRLLDGPRLCPYVYCNCTVPIQRGMIEGVGASEYPGTDGEDGRKSCISGTSM